MSVGEMAAGVVVGGLVWACLSFALIRLFQRAEDRDDCPTRRRAARRGGFTSQHAVEPNGPVLHHTTPAPLPRSMRGSHDSPA